MIAKVIPAKRIPTSLPALDYIVPDHLKDTITIGQLVRIPFRRSEEYGVVQTLLEQNNEVEQKKLKPISEIVFNQPVLTKAQLDFIFEISEFYHVSTGFLLKTNLPPLQKRKLKNTSSTAIFSKQLSPAPHKPVLSIFHTVEEKRRDLQSLIQPAPAQTLILIPEIADAQKIAGLLTPEINQRSIIISSELTPKELFAAWMEIWRGEKNVIIGTRAALFLPWHNLQQIILDDEGNQNYKSWDMAPRFHTRDAALFLSKHHGAPIHLLAHTPSVETMFFSEKNVYARAGTPIEPIRKPTQIVDMRAQRRLKNFSLLSHDALEEFNSHPTGDIFFFINRRGTVGYVGCQDCGTVLQCPHCNISLTYHQKNNTLNCHYCGWSEPMLSQCKKCAGTNVNMYGAGTQLAEDLVKKIMNAADTRTIVRIDSDQDARDKLRLPGEKIIIGTQMAWPHLAWERISLCVFLDADSSLFIPEYKIAEQVWQQLRNAQFNLPSNSSLVIQTDHPEHTLFAHLFDPQTFYAQQIAERRALGYPPFKFLLKLYYGSPDRNAVTTETERMRQYLDDLTKTYPDITIRGPWEALPAYHNGQYWNVLLVKMNYENYKKTTKAITAQLPDAWKIDPNPNSILSFS
jgi:primosomal protein N' (replication factor Y)